jgi:hypothetical protein
METHCSAEMLARIYQSTERYIPEDYYFDSKCRKNVQSDNLVVSSSLFGNSEGV